MYLPKSDPDELIRNALSSGRKTPSELKEICTKKNVSKQTYHRHLKRLVESGEVKCQKYYESIAPSIDSREILSVIQNIDDAIRDKNWEKCNFGILLLEHKCHVGRTGLIPDLLTALAKYVNIPQLFEDDSSRFELALIMHEILRNEIELGNPKVATQIEKTLLEPTCKIALHSDRKSRLRALHFLCLTDKKRSVDVILEILGQPIDQQTDIDLESYRHALLQSNLAKKQASYIQNKLMELAESNDARIRLKVKRLLKNE